MATNKRYYWIKLKKEFFTDKRIKRLRRTSGGDTYTIIQIKLLLLSLKDEGDFYYDGVESDFIKELALTMDETDTFAVEDTMWIQSAEKIIKEYVQNQIKEGYYTDQVCSKEYFDPFWGEEVK